MRGPEKLFEKEDNWETDLGASFAGERVVVRGKDLFTELNDFSWHGLLLFMITGRVFKPNELELLDKIWALTISYPDPRVWNNRVAALAGSSRSTSGLGVGAACAVTEAKIYGAQPNIAAIDFLQETLVKVEAGQDLSNIVKAELKERRLVAGYGRPIARGDERIPPTEKIMKQLGFADGKHVRLAYEIEKILLAGRLRMQMNITGLAAAVGADMGFTAKQYSLWLTNGFNAGTIACYTDALGKEEGTLFPLRCERIKYLGQDNRAWT